MKSVQVNEFTLHNDRGQSVLDAELKDWKGANGDFEVYGSVVRYTWRIDGAACGLVNEENRLNIKLFPDYSGFICFDNKRKFDNCTLLDPYGKERMRLIVPWELTGQDVPKHAEMWFRNIDGPYDNPITGEKGKFGVSAWIEYAGDYYFELDYHTGKFLWGKPIRF